MLFGQVWHYWIAVPLAIGAILFVVATIVGYLTRSCDRSTRPEASPRSGGVAGAIDWTVAERVAGRASGKDPFAESYHYASLAPDFDRLTAIAEDQVAEATGLQSLSGPGRARVTDRQGWVHANIASFQRLLRPVTDRLDERMASSPFAPVARRIAGAEVGVLLGWMSSRVLGQYDLLVIEDEDPEDQDIVYFVGPNILGLEKRFAFPPEEFRHWLALHEVTHRAQFTGIPWMREHFLSLVQQTVGAVDADPKAFLESHQPGRRRDPLGQQPARRRRRDGARRVRPSSGPSSSR